VGRINEIYGQMIYVCENVSKVVQEKKAQGKKVVGMMPIYTPEEIVHAAGMFPVGCWGGTTTISKAAKYLPPFACSIMQAVMEFAEAGVYKDVDAFLVPTPCDTLKAISQNLIYACHDKKVIVMTHPQNNKMEAAARYCKTEYSRVKAALEELGGRTISDKDLNQSIDIYNEHRAAMMEFLQIMADNPGVITAVNRHYIVKSSYFMWKEEHTALVKELNSLLQKEAPVKWSGKKIILAGIMAEPNSLLSLLDEFEMAVVGDELAQESRQFRTMTPAGKDPLERLACQWQNVEACSVVLDGKKKRAGHIAELATKNKADGVIFCQMKFCDPEEFDYPSIAKACGKINMPLLNLEVDQLAESTGQARTRIQAFKEQISY
jgi:(R)-2-hydroxyisocaproyl-CoA dehydratase beta subunit